MAIFSRRKFLKLGLGAAALTVGGKLAYSLLPLNARMAVDEATEPLSDWEPKNLRQVVEGSERSRAILWQSEEELEAPGVEVRGTSESGHGTRFQAMADLYEDDGKRYYIYRAYVIDWLPPEHPREFRVIAKDKASSWHPLPSLGADEELEVIVFPDSQCGDYGVWEKTVQTAMQKCRWPGLYINMGDLVDNGGSDYQWQAWFAGLAGLREKAAFAPVMGNHDVYGLDWESREPYAWLRQFAVRSGGGPVGQYFYSFDFGPAHFTVVNTVWYELFQAGIDVLDGQLDWIAEDLASTDRPWKIVLSHRDFLLYPIANLRDDVGFEDESILMPVLEAGGADLVLTAHIHTYRNHGYIRDFARAESGTYYICTGVAGDVRYDWWGDHYLDVQKAPQPETDNFLTLSITPDSIKIKCIRVDGKVLDEVTLTH